LPCRDAHAAYRRERRRLERADPWLPAADALVRLEQLAREGVGIRRVAALVNLSPSFVQRIRNGRARRIRSSTARAILTLEPRPTPGTLLRPARARVLLRWFLTEGFTLTALAVRLGLDPDTVACRGRFVRSRTEARLAAFRRLLTE
jgi:hypothetical protein